MTVKSEPKIEGSVAQPKIEGSVAQIEEDIHVESQEAPAIPFATATPVPSFVAPTTFAATTANAATTPSSTDPTRVPPNAPPGGQWTNRKTVGPATWATCTIISVCTCIFILLPCGLWAFLCPCDQERVYVVHGRVYNEQGHNLSSA